MTPEHFFRSPQHPTQRRYEALRAFYLEGQTAEQVATAFNYTLSSVYSLTRDFKQQLKCDAAGEQFFVSPMRGRRSKDNAEELQTLIVTLRKKYLSVPDIKAVLDSLGQRVSEKYVYQVIHQQGFARLPRRSRTVREHTFDEIKLEAAKAELLGDKTETFQTQNTIGVLCLLPYLQRFGIDQLLEHSDYPSTRAIPRLNALLSFVALKAANIRRYTVDDLWCMDRGLGLFAGLNVLPKAAWFSSYSHRVSRAMNLNLLQRLTALWSERGLLCDTANLDFTTIPYWGDETHLENNWSGTRHKALASISAALAHDPDSGLITYGDTNVRHDNKAAVAVEFLDFYQRSGNGELKYVVFDSKFTTYENLARLDDAEIKFVTIRRRGPKIVSRLQGLANSAWKTIRVPTGAGRTRVLKALDEEITPPGYGRTMRQVALSGHKRERPALIITNDFELDVETLVRKYARRWLVEKTISEQIEFFHLNRLSSSMVIKVDFDLTMTLLAHNLYRLLAADLPGYSQQTAMTLFERFLCNSGDIRITDAQIIVEMKKKRHLPALLTAMEAFQHQPIPWLGQRTLVFRGASRS